MANVLQEKLFRIKRLLGADIGKVIRIEAAVFQLAYKLIGVDVENYNESRLRKEIEKTNEIRLPWNGVVLPFQSFVFVFDDGEFYSLTYRHGVMDFETDGSKTKNFLTGEIEESLNLIATSQFSCESDGLYLDDPKLEKHVSGYSCINLLNVLCQIIARQDLTEKQTVDYSKLNKKRVKNGKLPLPTMTRIVLRRSAEELARNTIQMHAVNTEQKATGKRRLHDVRSHIRLKNGRIEIVRTHKRGDASLGSVEQLRIVR